MSDLKVEGLGKNNVPKVKGMEGGQVDVTAVPTPTPPKEVEKVDVTAVPTPSPVKEAEKVDVTAVPTSNVASVNVASVPTPSAAPSVQKVDVTATPTINASGAQKVDLSQMPTASNPPQSSSSPNYTLYIMIGVGAFVLVAIIIIIVTSIGGKKLVCTMEENDDYYNTKGTITMRFDGDDKVKSVSLETVVDYSNSKYHANEEDSYYEEEMMEGVKSYQKTYDNVKYKRNGKVITVTYDYKESQLKEFDNKNYEDIKKELERVGMTCK